MKQIVKKAFLFSSLLALTSLSAQTAHAGFEWRPPQDNRAQDNRTVAPIAPPRSETAPIQMLPIPVAPVETETAIEVPQRLITPTQQHTIQNQILSTPVQEIPVQQAPVVMPPVAQQPVITQPVITPIITPIISAPITLSPQDFNGQEFTRPVAPPDVAPVAPRTAITQPQPIVPQPIVSQPVVQSPVQENTVQQNTSQAKPFNDNVIVRSIERPVEKPAQAAPVSSPVVTPKQEPRVLPPVKHMNTVDASEINRPFRVKRDPVPSLYFDEAPIVLGKTPRERKLSEIYEAPIVSSTRDVVIFDPDAAPMPRYSDVETPKEFARGFDNRGFDGRGFDGRGFDNVFTPASSTQAVAGAPQSILPSEAIIEEPIGLGASPVVVETVQPVSAPVVAPVVASTLRDEDFQSPLPVVSRSIDAQPVDPIRQSTHDAYRDFAPVAQTIQPQFAPVQVAAAPVHASALMPVPADGTVQGFGKRVPLVIAVRQIAPENYEFDFSQDVDMGALVDWNGGQAWQHVMNDTLATYGLSYSINDATRVVSVYKQGYAPIPQQWEQPMQAIPVSAPALTPADYQAQYHALAQSQLTPQSRAQHGTLVSDAADFGQTNPVHIQQNTQVIAPVVTPVVAQAQVAKELPQIAYKAPESAQGQQTTDGNVWYGAKDSTLRSVLRDWSSKANVELYWDSQFDYPLQATVVVKGSFEEAVQRVLEGFEQAQPRPLGRLHRNTDNGPSVLIVEANDLLD